MEFTYECSVLEGEDDCLKGSNAKTIESSILVNYLHPFVSSAIRQFKSFLAHQVLGVNSTNFLPHAPDSNALK